MQRQVNISLSILADHQQKSWLSRTAPAEYMRYLISINTGQESAACLRDSSQRSAPDVDLFTFHAACLHVLLPVRCVLWDDMLSMVVVQDFSQYHLTVACLVSKIQS